MLVEAITIKQFKQATGLTQSEINRLIDTSDLVVISCDGRSKGREYRRYFVPVTMVTHFAKPIEARSLANLLDMMTSENDSI